MSENPLLRTRMAEIGAKLTAARTARDVLHVSPPSNVRDERLKIIDREIAILSDRMKALVAELVSN